MPDPSTPCGRATHETALWPFQGWLAHRAGGLRQSSTSMDTPCRTPMSRIHCLYGELDIKTPGAEWYFAHSNQLWNFVFRCEEHLYTRLRWLVRPLVGWLVGPSVPTMRDYVEK
jgi:hypothetical protein